MAAQDDEHKALLNQHNRRKQQHDLAVEEVKPTRRSQQAWQGFRRGVVAFFSLSLSPALYSLVPFSLPIPMLQAERLRLEYDRMEDWKESRCRCCPKCGRVVEKLSGCDLMVCGKWLCAYTCLLARLPAELCVSERGEERGEGNSAGGGRTRFFLPLGIKTLH